MSLQNLNRFFIKKPFNILNCLENMFLKKVLLTFLLAFCCIGCFSSKRSLEKPKKVALNLNLPQEPTTLDPRKGGDIYSSALHFLLYEGLTKISPSSSCDYGLAHKIDLSQDRLTYTFHLKEAFWSDGSAITAKDFEYSWKSMLDPSFPCPNAHLLYPIAFAEEAKTGLCSLDQVGIRSVDDKTLEVVLKSPTPYFLNLISFCVFSPVQHQTTQGNFDESGKNVLSTGPYILKSWKHHDVLVLEKNPYYWDCANVSLEEIDIHFIDNETTALELFAKKELDILGLPFTNIPIDALESYAKTPLLQGFPVGKTYFCSFNVEHPLFSNQHIRKAFSMAIDRQAVVDTLGISNEIPATNFVPPALKNGLNAVYFEMQDIEGAKQELAQGLQETGLTIKDFENITFIYPQRENSHSLCQILQQQWLNHLGINLKLECLDFKIFLEKLSTSQYALCQYNWVAQYDDPMNILERFRKKSNPKNYCNWENVDYIELLDRSAYHQGSARNSLLEEAEKIILDQMPIAPIFHSATFRMIQPYVKGVFSSSIGSIHLENIEFCEETPME